MFKLIQTITVLFILSFVFSSMSLASFQKGANIFESKCIRCHDNKGTNANIPILQGQEPRYIEMALAAYASGDRPDNIGEGRMRSRARQLSADEARSVATFLAASDPCQVKFEIDTDRKGFMDEFKAGQAKFQEASCMHCHSSFHHAAPRLIGQRQGYLKKTIAMYRAKQRGKGVTAGRDHGLEVMERVAAKLSDDDIQNLSTYISALKLMRSCD